MVLLWLAVFVFPEEGTDLEGGRGRERERGEGKGEKGKMGVQRENYLAWILILTLCAAKTTLAVCCLERANLVIMAIPSLSKNDLKRKETKCTYIPLTQIM